MQDYLQKLYLNLNVLRTYPRQDISKRDFSINDPMVDFSQIPTVQFLRIQKCIFMNFFQGFKHGLIKSFSNDPKVDFYLFSRIQKWVLKFFNDPKAVILFISKDSKVEY